MRCLTPLLLVLVSQSTVSLAFGRVGPRRAAVGRNFDLVYPPNWTRALSDSTDNTAAVTTPNPANGTDVDSDGAASDSDDEGEEDDDEEDEEDDDDDDDDDDATTGNSTSTVGYTGYNASDWGTAADNSSATGTTTGPVTNLTADEVRGWAVPATYAAAAYCGPERVSTWSCIACAALGNHTVVTGGDNADTPWWYVADNGEQVVIAITGMNPDSPASVALAFDFTPVVPENIGRNTPEDVLVHRGVYTAFTRVRRPLTRAVRAAVRRVAANVAANAAAANVAARATAPNETAVAVNTTYPAANDTSAPVNATYPGNATASDVDGRVVVPVLVVGHSFGGALAQLVGLDLAERLNTTTAVAVRSFVPPRSGNPAWANWMDSVLPPPQAQYIVNKDDATPHLPPRDWGFRHSGGEVWISNATGQYVSCSGQENAACAASVEPGNLFETVAAIPRIQHLGPFAGVFVGICLG